MAECYDEGDGSMVYLAIWSAGDYAVFMETDSTVSDMAALVSSVHHLGGRKIAVIIYNFSVKKSLFLYKFLSPPMACSTKNKPVILQEEMEGGVFG